MFYVMLFSVQNFSLSTLIVFRKTVKTFHPVYIEDLKLILKTPLVSCLDLRGSTVPYAVLTFFIPLNAGDGAGVDGLLNIKATTSVFCRVSPLGSVFFAMLGDGIQHVNSTPLHY